MIITHHVVMSVKNILGLGKMMEKVVIKIMITGASFSFQMRVQLLHVTQKGMNFI